MKKALIAVVALVAAGLPAQQVAATPPEEAAFVVETSLLAPTSPFVAFGPAVDAGIACADGTVVDAAINASGFSRTGFNVHALKHFTCADGSGEFLINLTARIDFRRGVTFQWNVLRGTGDYATLHGAGSGFGFPGDPCGDPNDCVLDVYFGGLHLD